MGLALSSSNVQNTVNSLTTVVNSTISNTTQSLQETCTATNTFFGVFGSIPISITPGNIVTQDCSKYTNVNSLSVNQSAQNTCSITGGLTTSLTQQINNNLVSNINQWLTSNATANNGFLGFGISIAASQGINTLNLSQQIANSLTLNASQLCNASLNDANNGTIYVCGSYPNGIVFTQSSVNTNLTSCMLQNLTTNITNNQVLNDIVQKAASQANASNSGLSLDFLKWIIIAVVVVVVLVIIGVLLYFIFGSKSTPQSGEQPEQSKEREKEMLEREIMEKKEGYRREFERRDAATSPTTFDSVKSLAKRYGSQIGEYANRL